MKKTRRKQGGNKKEDKIEDKKEDKKETR